MYQYKSCPNLGQNMEVTTIPDIRERNDRPKDKQPKHQAVSIVQRQMVQRFVKELNDSANQPDRSDSANQPDRSDSAERTATEQVETTTREIVHEAVQLPRRAIQHPARRESADSSANAQLEQSAQPHHAPESPRERTDAPRTQPDATPPQSTPTPAPQEQVRRAYVQQTAKTAASALPITSEQPWARHREYAASAYGGYTHPTGTATAAEHTGTYTAGTGPSCLCPANCKNGHTSVTDHVGAAAAYHSDRAIGGKYAATAHGRCAHLVRTEAAAERTSVHAAGADPSRLCPASHKGDRVSTTNHAGTAGGAASHSDHANGRKCTASAHERCTRPDRTETATKPPGTHSTRTGPTRPRQADKEIPRRKTGCAG